MFTLIQNYKNTFISFIRNELNEWVSVGLQEDLWLLSNDQDIKDALSEIKKIMDEQVENDWIIWEGWEVWAKLFGSYTKKQIIEKWLWKNELDLSDNWIIDKQIIKLLEKMKESGCHQLTFAIESGNQHILTNIIQKPLILSKVKPLVDKAHQLGIRLHAFCICGIPGETIENMKETYNFVKNCGFDVVKPIYNKEPNITIS